MKSRFVHWSLALAVAGVLAAGLLGWPRVTPSSEPGIPFDAQGRPAYLPGEVLVGLKAGLPAGALGGNVRSLAQSLRELRGLRSGPAGHSVQRMQLAPGVGIGQAILALQQDPAVAYAEPNYLNYLLTNPDDTKYGMQWNLTKVRWDTVWNAGGTPLADGNGVIIAVIDTGVAYDHLDLAVNMWDGSTATCPSGGTPIHGCDFADNDADPYPINSDHGTHVAGIAAAVTNNTLGVAGVAFKAQIMALKVFPDNGGGAADSDIHDALIYAADHSAKVANLSLGRGGSMPQTVKDAIAYAESKGLLVVAAAGNSSSNNDFSPDWPANFAADGTVGSGVISVAASDTSDALASFSNYGASTVSIAAPGTGIWSTTWDATTKLSEDGSTFVGPTDCSSNATTCMNGTIFAQVANDCATSGGGTCEWGAGKKNGALYLVGDISSSTYANNINGTITTQAVNTTGANRLVLHYWAVWDLRDCDQDYVDIQVRDGSSNWNTLPPGPITKSLCSNPTHTITGNMNGTYGGFVEFTHDITQYANANLSVQFVFVTNGSGHTTTVPGGVQILAGPASVEEDLSVTDHTSSPTGVVTKNGTSMASPMVAGVAALALQANSSLTPAQLKTRILETGDVIPGLHCKTTTSARVNADAAVTGSASNPPQNNSSCPVPTTTLLTTSGGGGGCLITWMTEDWLPRGALRPLRALRGALWQEGPWGRAFVRGYYRASAAIIAWVRAGRAEAWAAPHTATI